MKPGLLWKTDVEGKIYTVWLTGHFVERFEVDLPDRPAAKRAISEDAVRTAIEQALSSIAEISFGDPDASGVIYAQARRFIMTWSLRPRADGFQVNMTTIKPGLDFKARSTKDYEIKVNPVYRIRFASEGSPALKAAVIEDLARSIPTLEDGALYHEADPEGLVDYWVEKAGNLVEILDAHWTSDVYEVYVP